MDRSRRRCPFYGWIDGQSRALDATLQRYTPRRPRSLWAKLNRERVARLIHRMKPAGLAEVERAKADGRWDQAYDSPRTSAVPPDLDAALAKRPRARAAFDALSRLARYTIFTPPSARAVR